jgi:outer membrane protein
MKTISLQVAAAAVGLVLSGASSPWSVYAGGAYVAFSTSASLKVNGVSVPGGDAKASNNGAAVFGVIFHFTPVWSVELALGLPPTSTLTGTGTLASAGALGKVEYGPAVLSVRRSFFTGSKVQPYIGAGVNYTLALNSKDAFVQGLHVKSAGGPVLQIGCEVPISTHVSFVLDMKKVWLRTTATGTLPAFGGAPATAEVRLNPLIITGAFSYRF